MKGIIKSMSHFLINQKLIREVMENSNITNSQKDKILLNLYLNGKFKGGEEMMSKTISWFIETFPEKVPEFELFIRLK